MTNNYKGPSGSIPIKSIQWDSSWPEFAENDERHRLFSYLEERFGIPESIFDDYCLFRRKKAWWLLRNSPLIHSVCRLKVELPGLRAFQRVGHFLKPTTRMIQVFGDQASRARMDIEEGQLREMLSGGFLEFQGTLDNGYMILAIKGRVLGLGILINGRIRSQLPKKSLMFLLR